VERAYGILDGQRLRDTVRELGRAKRGEGRCFGKPATLQETNKSSQHGESAGERAALDPVLGATCQISTKIGGSQLVYGRQARQRAQMLGQEIEKKGEIAAVCGNGMRRGATLPGQPSG